MHGHIQQDTRELPPTDPRHRESAEATRCSRSPVSAFQPSPESFGSGPGNSARNTGVTRLYIILMQLLLVAGGIWMVGCEQCEERFCSGVRVVTVNMMTSASACCENPEGPECEGLDERFNQFVLGLHEAYKACLDGNLDRLRELLELIIRSLSRVFLIAFCAEDIDLGDWLADACHPYLNSSTVFLASDQITADLGFAPAPQFMLTDGLLQPALNHPAATQLGETASRRYRFTEGSAVEVDAWWGADQFFVEGHLVVDSALSDSSGNQTHQIVELVLELQNEFGHSRGRVTFNGGSAPGFVRCTPQGHGMLGASVHIDGAFGFSGESLLADHARTVWLELPITISQRGGWMGSGDAVSAHEVFPVDPVFADRLASFPLTGWPFDGDLQDDDSEFMPCHRVDGLTVREWRMLQRMQQCFPQCFTGE